jgi:hypothetical protein
MSSFNLNNDEELKKILKKDNPPLQADPAIAERLNYHFLIKSPMQKVHSNSFAGFTLWLFSFKSIAIKTCIAVIFSSVLLFKSEFNERSSIIAEDTCVMKNQLPDTNYVFRDTCGN